MANQGELLFPGYLGYFFVALSFGAALLSLIAYFNYTNKPSLFSWQRIARGSFLVHGLSVIGIMSVLFFLIYNHRYEYHYVWSHSSNILPVKYMISCFWEGQEGSFLLWSFWHVILGLLLIKTARKWEGPVMSMVLLAQVTLSSMLLGFEIFGVKIGSNPFILLRDAMPNAPIFEMPNYTSFLKDGQGLNPLLQNYWMVIHPPVLFLGFASTIVPFGFAVGGLWLKKFSDWVKPALPWTLFSLMILGTGVLMGGAWAYEALNFGGFWAWDPVENAALVPWLFILAGLHTMVIFKNRGTSLLSSFIFIKLGFLLILYATFLTRSGVLGDSSVHSFTDLGLSGQLLMFIFIFLGISIFLLVKNWRQIPAPKDEDRLYSREFWMFIAALVFSLSAFHITFVTSIPVFNKIPGVNMAPPAELIQHYNKVQLPIAIIIMLITAFGQYLKYKSTAPGRFFKKIGIALGITAVLSTGLIYITGMQNVLFNTLLVTSVFGVVGNFNYMLPQLKSGKFRFSGASISHIGFALLILGALISTSQQRPISINKEGIDYGEAFEKEDNQTNILLRKNEPKVMRDYVVTYVGDSVKEPNTYYKVHYQKLDEESLDTTERFTLKPRAQINPDMGLIASPDTRHYLTQDVYTHVTSVPDKSSEDFKMEYEEPVKRLFEPGDTIKFKDFLIHAQSVNTQPDQANVPVNNYDIATSLDLKIKKHRQEVDAKPLFIIKGGRVISPEKKFDEIGLKLQFSNVLPEKEKLELTLAKGEQPIKDYIIMKAIVFPYINFLWLGCVLMVIGMGIANFRRVKENKAA